MVADPEPEVLGQQAGATPASAQFWDRRYQEGSDGGELGQPAPPLQEFLAHHRLAPQPPGPVLVPGCGRGHEARLLGELGFAVVGLSEALWEPARNSATGRQPQPRDNEWLGLWHKPANT